MKKIIFSILGLLLFCGSLFAMSPEPPPKIVETFESNDVYLIRAFGFPKVGLNGKQAELSAYDAALLNAEFLAKQRFSTEIDVVALGCVIKREYYKTYGLIVYRIEYPNLRFYYKKR